MTISLSTPVALAILAVIMFGLATWAYETAAPYGVRAVVDCTTDSDCADKNPTIRF